MVKIREVHLIDDQDQVDIEDWALRIADKSGMSPELVPTLRDACELAAEIQRQNQFEGRSWSPGVNSLITGLEMAEILAELGLDDEGLVAAVL